MLGREGGEVLAPAAGGPAALSVLTGGLLFQKRHDPLRRPQALLEGLFCPPCAVFGKVQMQLRTNLKTMDDGNIFRFLFFSLGELAGDRGWGRVGGDFLELKGFMSDVNTSFATKWYIYMCVCV